MTDCERAEELIPWYVAGSLSDEESGELAMHLATCDPCRAELARMVPLAMDLQAALGTVPGAPTELRETVTESAKRSGAPGIDVGSFLLGLSMGMSASGRGDPLQGDLRILGRKVPLFRLQQGGTERD
ncbi:MAG: zf-HC2 domain-containing protein [Candidatus Bipolaricaulota bacterium]|nr:MAG: zf-HC2 domain-containing protein [Candidatus Bipolaricaulota bacterium]